MPPAICVLLYPLKQTFVNLCRKDFCMFSCCNHFTMNNTVLFDDGHGDYNRSYDRGYDDFDYADYSTDHRDNNFRNYEKKRRKTNKEIIEDMLKRWD